MPTRIDELERRVHVLESNQHIHRLLHEVRADIQDLKEHTMADAASILAKISANTNILKSIDAAANALEEGNANIVALIADLKAQIAAGTAPDFGPLDAAADEQGTVIAGIADSVQANTGTP